MRARVPPIRIRRLRSASVIHCPCLRHFKAKVPRASSTDDGIEKPSRAFLRQMKQPRVIRWIALAAGIFLVPCFALILLLPMIIDSEAVKSRARAFVAEKTEGLTRFEKIDIFWFPRPGVVIRNAAI